jgi:hypothetical protein
MMEEWTASVKATVFQHDQNEKKVVDWFCETSDGMAKPPFPVGTLLLYSKDTIK